MTMNTWAFRTLIVPTDYRELASSLAFALGGTAGEDMFTTGLSASGESPATHYVSTGYIGAEFASMLPLYDPATGERTDGNPVLVTQLANDAGLTVTEQQVQDLFTASDITEQEPFAAFARLDLQIVNADAPAN